MIVSASRRTDIPAFFSSWLMNRIREGYVLVRNPMNPQQVSNITLSPSIVDCIVFWTKNPTGILRHLPSLRDYNYYFQFTINAYGKALEPNLISPYEAIELFIYLSELLGPERLIWRYDPILLTDKYTIDWHISNFTEIALKLSGHTRKCVISFLDLYKKSKRNLLGVRLQSIDNSTMYALGGKLVKVAHQKGIKLNTCAEEIDLSSVGILPGKCIDDKLIEEITGRHITVSKDKTQRNECGCVASIDIGSYNSCPHNCLYCYANYSLETVKKNYAQHDPKSPLLFGHLTAQDIVRERKVSSCFEVQQTLL